MNTEPGTPGAAVRLNEHACLMVDGFIRIEQIEHGLNAGRWAWVLHVDSLRRDRGRYYARQGIAPTRSQALATARRALAWHQKQVQA